MKKRLLSMALCLCMVLGLMPLHAAAVGTAETMGAFYNIADDTVRADFGAYVAARSSSDYKFWEYDKAGGYITNSGRPYTQDGTLVNGYPVITSGVNRDDVLIYGFTVTAKPYARRLSFNVTLPAMGDNVFPSQFFLFAYNTMGVYNTGTTEANRKLPCIERGMGALGTLSSPSNSEGHYIGKDETAALGSAYTQSFTGSTDEVTKLVGCVIPAGVTAYIYLEFYPPQGPDTVIDDDYGANEGPNSHWAQGDLTSRVKVSNMKMVNEDASNLTLSADNVLIRETLNNLTSFNSASYTFPSYYSTTTMPQLELFTRAGFANQIFEDSGSYITTPAHSTISFTGQPKPVTQATEASSAGVLGISAALASVDDNFYLGQDTSGFSSQTGTWDSTNKILKFSGISGFTIPIIRTNSAIDLVVKPTKTDNVDISFGGTEATYDNTDGTYTLRIPANAVGNLRVSLSSGSNDLSFTSSKVNDATITWKDGTVANDSSKVYKKPQGAKYYQPVSDFLSVMDEQGNDITADCTFTYSNFWNVGYTLNSCVGAESRYIIKDGRFGLVQQSLTYPDANTDALQFDVRVTGTDKSGAPIDKIVTLYYQEDLVDYRRFTLKDVHGVLTKEYDGSTTITNKQASNTAYNQNSETGAYTWNYAWESTDFAGATSNPFDANPGNILRFWQSGSYAYNSGVVFTTKSANVGNGQATIVEIVQGDKASYAHDTFYKAYASHFENSLLNNLWTATGTDNIPVTSTLITNIVPKTLTVNGITAVGRPAAPGDKTVELNIDALAVSGAVGEENVSIQAKSDVTPVGTLEDDTAGTNRAVTVDMSQFELTGADIGNYKLPKTITLPEGVDITGTDASVSVTQENGMYDQPLADPKVTVTVGNQTLEANEQNTTLTYSGTIEASKQNYGPSTSKPTQPGTYTVKAEFDNKVFTGSATSAEFTIERAACSFDLTTDVTNNTWEYGTTAIKLRADISTAAVPDMAAISSITPPDPGMVDFYYQNSNGKYVRLNETPGKANSNDPSEFAVYKSASRQLPAGTESTVIAVYGGDSLLKPGFGSMTVTQNKRTYLVANIDTAEATASKTYDGTTMLKGVKVRLSGIAPGDTLSATIDATVSSPNADTYFWDNSDPLMPSITDFTITLTGEAANWYAKPTLSKNSYVHIAAKKITATPTVAEKVYDGYTAGTVTDVTFEGILQGETMIPGTDYKSEATFTSADVADPAVASVYINWFNRNYALQPSTISVNSKITPRPIAGPVSVTLPNATPSDANANAGDTLEVVGCTPTKATLSYSWSIDGKTVGTDAATYTVQEADAGKTLTVTVTGTGNYSGALTASYEIGKKTLTFYKVGINGDTTVGSKLTADLKDLEDLNIYKDLDANSTMQWYRVDGTATTPIDGATALDYTVTRDDLGKQLMAVLTGTGLYTGSVSSNPVTIQKGAANVTVTQTNGTYKKLLADPVVKVTGGGETLTAAGNTTFSYVGTGTTSYEASPTRPTLPGTYTVTAAYDDGTYAGTDSADFTIKKAESNPALDDGTATNTYTYGDTITLTATPVVAMALEDEPALPAENKVDFYYKNAQNQYIKLSGDSPIELDNNGTATYVYDTKTKVLPIGKSTIVAVYGGSDVLNGSFQSMEVTIDKKPLTGAVTAGTTSTKVYNGSTDFSNVAVTLTGVLGSDDVTATASLTASSKNAGNSLSVATATVALSGEQAGWYTAPEKLTGKVSITKAPISVATATVSEKVYDGSKTASATVTFAGLVGGESLTADTDYTVTAAFQSANVAASATADVTVTLKDTEKAKNYNLTSGAATANAAITAKAISGTVSVALDTDADSNNIADTGDTLKATGYTPADATLIYSWKIGDIEVGAESTYKVKDGDAGKQLTVTVTGSKNFSGTLKSASYKIGERKLTGTVAINGETTVGSIITAALTSTSGTPVIEKDYRVQWYRVVGETATKLEGENALNYTLTNDDLGKTLRVDLIADNTDSAFSGTVSKSIQISAVAPAAPKLTATASNSKVSLSWSAPFDGGSTLTGYRLYVKSGSGEYGTAVDVDSDATTYDVIDLTNGTTYTFKLEAVNAKGATESNEVTATPMVAFSGDNSVTYTITATAGAGGSFDTGKTVSVKAGDKADFTIKANKGYVIADVLVDGKSVGAVSSYTFTNVRANHTISATFKAADNSGTEMNFTDLNEKEWYYDGVKYVCEQGLFKGTSATTFSPDANMTRQQMWTVLARMAGENPANMDEARAWAMKSGVSDGTNPANDVTREEFITLLWRLAGSPKASRDMSSYTDFGTVADYAKEAVRWAVENGIVSGTSATSLSPKGSATRAQIAVILARYAQK